MAIYRKGEDQFELEHRALLQGTGHKYPRTAIHALDKDVTLQKPPASSGKSHHVPARPASPDEVYRDDYGNETATVSYSPGYMLEDFPVSGADVARARAKEK